VDSNGVTQPAGTSYCTLWPNGVINPVNFNSISTNLMNTFVPLPNSGSDFFFNPITTVKTDQEIFKIDHTFNSHDSLWGYGLLQRNPTQDTLPFVGATLPGFAEIARAHTQQYVVAWNHAFNGNMLNEVRLGYTRLNLVSVQPVKPVLPSSVGFNGIIPQFPAGAGIPVIAVTGLFTLGFSDDGPQPRKDDTYQLTDNFTKVVGRHAFKVGFEGRRFHVDNPFFFSNGGHFDFAGSGPFSTGVPGADYLLGIPDDYQQSSGGVTDAKAQEYYSYFQDQFKLRSNLTLNYGVGWQIDTPLTDRFNKGVAINCFLPGHQSTVFPTAPQGLTFPGDTGCSSAGYSTKWGHFGPRFGVAYSPGTSGKTSIRAGAGLYFNRSEEELTLQNLLAPPFSLFDVGINDDTQLPMATTPSFANPYTDVTGNFSIPNKYPFTPPQPGNTNINFGPFEPLSINVIDPKFTTPRALNYNLTFERELPGRMIFSAAYVGAEARRLIGVREQNPGINPAGCAADPNCVNGRVFQNVFFPQNFKYNGSVFGGVGQQGTFNTSNYNALQTTVRKAFSRGIEFLASYTWSHSLDTGSSFENSAFGGSPRAQDFYNQHVDYADSEFDVRHRFVASYVYSFPQLKDFSKGLQYLIGGWRVAGITTLQTGFPIFTSDGGFRSLTCTAFTKYSCPDHGNYLGGFHATNPRTATFVNQIKGGTTANNQYYFDPNIFSLEAFGTLGSARRDNFHGPGLNNTDLALYKDLPIRESMKFELRLEGFNVFNHAQFKNPSGNINSHNFGRVTALQIAPRIVQIAGKFYF
jgi:hypothetical protein